MPSKHFVYYYLQNLQWNWILIIPVTTIFCLLVFAELSGETWHFHTRKEGGNRGWMLPKDGKQFASCCVVQPLDFDFCSLQIKRKENISFKILKGKNLNHNTPALNNRKNSTYNVSSLHWSKLKQREYDVSLIYFASFIPGKSH